jgi:biopolymer transport protein ExbD
MNWIVRLDVILLAFMLAYVVIVVTRVSYRARLTHRAGEIDSAGRSKLAALLSTDLGSLKAIASGAPYLGLAGTCPGIMTAIVFGGNMGNSTFQAMLGARVAAALVTTAAGILVAVPATFSYNYLCTLKDTLEREVSRDPSAQINRYRQSTPKHALTKQFSQLPAFALIAAPCMAAVVLVYSSFSAPREATGFGIELAPPRCAPNSIDRQIVLHITDEGNLFLNTEQQDWNSLASLLSGIYSLRAERTLYLTVDDGVPFQTVADFLDIVENVPATTTPEAVVNEVRKLDIRVKLITPAVVNAQCPTLIMTASHGRTPR